MNEANNEFVDTEDRFAFGLNWSQFIEKHFSNERVEIAKEKLLSVLRLDSLQGMSFLDIGCGSGLHSLAALRAGASRVFSFDYDQISVKTASRLRRMHGDPDNWIVTRGSVLDRDFMSGLDKADIVYSWGVLHHTGHMWKALENARIPLKQGGLFFIALYSYTTYANGILSGLPSPEQWLRIKKRYNSFSDRGKRLYDFWYVFTQKIRRKSWNPAHMVRNALTEYQLMRRRYVDKSRGMDYWTDIRDWLGGWPMEFVRERELFLFARDKLDLELLDFITGEGNSEFLFRSDGCRNHWDVIMAKRLRRDLSFPVVGHGGFMWSASTAELSNCGDSDESPRRSGLVLYEDDLPLSYAHSTHDTIRQLGAGRYSHWVGKGRWKDRLYFSASDNTDPNVNGHRYHYVVF